MSGTYLVGLPVLVTVSNDGSVTYEVDTAEAGDAVREMASVPAYGFLNKTVEHDALLIDMDHNARHPRTTNESETNE